MKVGDEKLKLSIVFMNILKHVMIPFNLFLRLPWYVNNTNFKPILLKPKKWFWCTQFWSLFTGAIRKLSHSALLSWNYQILNLGDINSKLISSWILLQNQHTNHLIHALISLVDKGLSLARGQDLAGYGSCRATCAGLKHGCDCGFSNPNPPDCQTYKGREDLQLIFSIL